MLHLSSVLRSPLTERKWAILHNRLHHQRRAQVLHARHRRELVIIQFLERREIARHHVHQVVRIAKQALRQHDLRDLFYRVLKRAHRFLIAFNVAKTIAVKLKPILAGSRLAR